MGARWPLGQAVGRRILACLCRSGLELKHAQAGCRRSRGLPPLAAGLFRGVRLAAKPPTAAAAPAFALHPGSSQLATVAPLDEIAFSVAPRQLPPIAELSVRAEGGVQPPAEAALAAARAAAAAADSGVGAYLAARAGLLEALPAGVDVAFEGVESGKPTVVVRPVPQGEQRLG